MKSEVLKAASRQKHIHVACIGNPNCGKTTLFNALTGSKLKVANWPGVTVERFEGETFYSGGYAGYLFSDQLHHRRESHKAVCHG